MELIATGPLCAKDIAQRLNIAVGTTQRHLCTSYHKLAAHGREEAVELFLRRAQSERQPGRGSAPAAQARGSAAIGHQDRLDGVGSTNPEGGMQVEAAPHLPLLGPLRGRHAAVAQLAAEGKSDREIGDLLGCAENTVGVHMVQIFKKTHLHSRAALTAWCLRQRMLGP